MKILIASDHAGLELKNQIAEALRKTDAVEDFGPFNSDSVDYPDYADFVCRRIQSDDASAKLTAFGILICGSGQGMALRANKYPFVRAALVYSDEITQMAREHNNANIICIGARFTDFEKALKWVQIFKQTAFAGGRHQTRVAKIHSSIP
ncbi:MAG: RpiB/LacA/LacB family sugar-phosphate isomerase [Bdellovibrio sp.]|nr:RpiB/LacA/LacB family sugar-phosphate isomerase [Bdellovibrio sp.]